MQSPLFARVAASRLSQVACGICDYNGLLIKLKVRTSGPRSNSLISSRSSGPNLRSDLQEDLQDTIIQGCSGTAQPLPISTGFSFPHSTWGALGRVTERFDAAILLFCSRQRHHDLRAR